MMRFDETPSFLRGIFWKRFFLEVWKAALGLGSFTQDIKTLHILGWTLVRKGKGKEIFFGVCSLLAVWGFLLFILYGLALFLMLPVFFPEWSKPNDN